MPHFVLCPFFALAC